MAASHMKNRRQASVAIAVSTFLKSGIAYAIDSSEGATKYRRLPLDFNIDSLRIPHPPTDNITEARLLLKMQAHRTPLQIAQIKAQSVNPIPLFWKCAGLNESCFPEQAQLLNEAVADTESILIELKSRFNRPRPSVVLPDIHAVVPVPWHTSYPSGHATQSIVIAALLSQIAPKSSRQLVDLAVQVGRNREIAGRVP